MRFVGPVGEGKEEEDDDEEDKRLSIYRHASLVVYCVLWIVDCGVVI